MSRPREREEGEILGTLGECPATKMQCNESSRSPGIKDYFQAESVKNAWELQRQTRPEEMPPRDREVGFDGGWRMTTTTHPRTMNTQCPNPKINEVERMDDDEKRRNAPEDALGRRERGYERRRSKTRMQLQENEFEMYKMAARGELQERQPAEK